eukprot:956212_1
MPGDSEWDWHHKYTTKHHDFIETRAINSTSTKHVYIIASIYWIQNSQQYQLYSQTRFQNIYKTCVYHRGIGMYSYIARSLRNYSVVRLMDDYHHVIRKFFNQLWVVHLIVSCNISFDIGSSVILKRINRNRQVCALRNDTRCEYFGGYNASDEVSVQKLMDKIYAHLILSFDAGYMLTQDKQIEDEIKNSFYVCFFVSFVPIN